MVKYKNQSKLFENQYSSEEHEDDVELLLSEKRPSKFDFRLDLKLKAGNLNHSVPIAAGRCYGDRIEEILEKTLNSDWFKERLRAIVGSPLH